MSSAVPLPALPPALHPLTTTATTTTLPGSPPAAARTTGTPARTPAAACKPTNSSGGSATRPSHPDYVQTLTVRDANGTVRELVFPKGLDLDRPKRARTTFSGDQLAALEREFRRNQYLVGRERSLLAARLGLSETQVKVWYQNRRTKHKRDREREHEAPSPALPTRPLLPSLPLTPPITPATTALYTLPTTSTLHALPQKLCAPTPTPAGGVPCTPPTTSAVSGFSGAPEAVLGREAPEGAHSRVNHEGRSPPVPAKLPSPPCHTSPESGLEYHMGVGGVKSDISFCHPLETTFSKTLPTLLGSFHSVPPGVAPSAFRPLLPRPLHPLALQHHGLAHSHPTWLP